MALTHDDVRALAAPFALEAHEWRKGRNNKDYVYITETAVVDRLNEVDPSWSLVVTDRAERDYETHRKTKDGEVYALAAHELVITVALTVKDVTRYGIGMAEVAPDAAEADKSAVTDALKRAARLFGVGGYLLNDPPDKSRFAEWLKQQGGKRPAQSAQPPAPAANGWTEDQARSLALEARRLNITNEEVLTVLGVEGLSQYAPGFSVARDQLQKYAKARPPADPPPQEVVF